MTEARTTSSPAGWRSWMADYLGLVIALGGLILIFSLTTKHFFSPETFRTIANQIPAALLVATGMTFVLIVAEIDLSVGSVLGLCGAMMGVALTRWNWPLWTTIPFCLLIGAACGWINGAVAQRWQLPTFIVTLGMMEMARGGAHAVSNSQTLYLGSVVESIAATSFLGLSLPFLLAMLVVILAQFTLSYAVLGRHMLAVGSNAQAARLCGIEPHRIKIIVFVINGFLVALGAIIDTSRFQSANPNAGAGYELQAIAAVVIGGTSLLGGRGSVLRTLFGVLIIAVLNSGLAAVGAKDEIKRLVTGAVIVAAVIVDYYRHRLTKRDEG